MTTSRMEAFSDGVLAIVLTIMVLKLDAPASLTLEAIRAVYPHFLAYLLSFLYVGIYWVNHHHLIQRSDFVSGRLLWKNLHWIFWMSLIPMATEWMGMHAFADLPAAFYGLILFMSAVAYHRMQSEVIRMQGADSKIAQKIGKDTKGKFSMLAYALATVLALALPLLSYIIYIAIALLWVVPDSRLED